MQRSLAWAIATVAAAYPVIVYVALERVPIAALGALLLVLSILRAILLARQGRMGAGAITGVGLVVMALAGGYTVATQSEIGVRLYPVCMSVGMLAVFAGSLLSPQPMIERFARLIHTDLSPRAVHYLRRVTVIWCGFFGLNALLALWTALYASWAVWTLYNGLISYGLVGVLLLGEYLFRQRYLATSGAAVAGE